MAQQWIYTVYHFYSSIMTKLSLLFNCTQCIFDCSKPAGHLQTILSRSTHKQINLWGSSGQLWIHSQWVDVWKT